MSIRPGSRYRPHREKSDWFGLFEGRGKKRERERRNAENEQNFKRWRGGYSRKIGCLFLAWVIGMALLIALTESVVGFMIWSLLTLLAYLYIRTSSEPPPPSVSISIENNPHFAAKCGGGGFLTGAIAGAYLGAGVGIVGGPFGAIAGTIPGAVIGGLVGLFGGHKVGTLIERPKVVSLSQAELATRRKQAGRAGCWAGMIAGAAGGAWYGAGIGLAAGPLGAIAGTIRGLITGSILGFVGGEKVGSRIPQALSLERTTTYGSTATVDTTGQKRLR
jgi:hypothetical protein